MPVPILPLVMGGASLLGNIFKAGSERRRMMEAKRALEKMQYPELTNVTEGLSVSTLGVDRQLRETSRSAASALDALSSAGTRAVVGGAAGVVSSTFEASAQATSDLDRQRKEIDRIASLDDLRKREIRENRLQAEIDGLSAELEAGRAGRGEATTGIFSSLGTISGALSSLFSGEGDVPDNLPVPASGGSSGGPGAPVLM